VRVADVLGASRPFRVLEPRTPIAEVVAAVAESRWQTTFPVLEATRLRGLVTSAAVQAVRADDDLNTLTVAADLMQAPVVVRPQDDLRTAAAAMLTGALKQIPVVDPDGMVVGFLEEVDVTRAYVAAMNTTAAKS